MSTSVWDPKPPKLPRTNHLIAVVLELTIVITFIGNHSLFGVALCGAYGWYSATWALFRMKNDD